MKSVFKYQLPLQAAPCELDLPADAELLTIHEQDGNICLWALVDGAATHTERRVFRIYGTGWDLHPELILDYVGNAFIGAYVWHVFEVLS